MPEPLIKLEFEAASDLLRRAQRIIVVTHVRPDGDAIGSLCGLGLALMEMGKQVTLAVDGGINDYLSFVPGSEFVLAALPHPQADLVICVDASDFARTGEVGRVAFALDVPKIVIDHHATNGFYGDVHLVHSDFVSTTEAVLHWLDHLGWEISQVVATALLTGFVTDTISFRVGPVTPTTLRQAARLMEHGADLRQISERMLVRVEPGQLQLMGRGLANLKMEDHVIWTYLRLSDFEELGLSTADKPELSTELLRDAEAYIACFLLETEEGDVRLSFRSVPPFDVGRIAAQFGGGGHAQAAGATLEKTSVEQAVEQIVPLLKAEAQRTQPLYKK